MGTVADKLTYLNTTKTNIKNAIINKGVSVSESDTFRSYADKIASIGSDAYKLVTDTTASAVKSLTTAPLPFNSLKVGIDAVQDLHGYDKPWVGGANINKLPLDDFTTTTLNDVTASITEDGGIKLVGTNNGTRSSFTISSASINPCYLESGTNTISIASALPSGVTLEWSGAGRNGVSYGSMTSATSKNISVTDGTKPFNYITLSVEVGYTVDTTIYLQVENGTTATPFSPYSNICPISGWDAVNLNECGKNLAKKTIHGYINYQNSKVVIDIDSESVVFYAVAGKTYTVSSSVTMSRSMLGLADTDNITNNYQLLEIIELSNEVVTWTATWTGWTVWYKCTTAQSGFADSVQVEIGTTATEYEPYNGQTYTENLATTNYGGYWDVTKGEIGGDRGYKLISELSWQKRTIADGRTAFISLISDAELKNNANDTNIMTSIYPEDTAVTSAYYLAEGTCKMGGTYFGRGYLTICDSRFESASDFKTAMGDVQITYDLATPTTTSTTPRFIKANDGTTNLWADSGKIEEVGFFEEFNA